ncbi:MAG TPA: hypothetical protein VFJ78_09630 [Gaiellaceae bacterium]|nr:hypothetical protein [Gaiellaceae bacterium]
MSMQRRFAVVLAAVGVATGGAASTSAFAADLPLGRHVSQCAQMSLGQRADAPAVTCTHDGMTMTFATFGAMVEHMRTSG